MDAFSKLKGLLCKHQAAMRETLRASRLKREIGTLLHVGVLGFLVMVALLKWTLLPPFSGNLQHSISPFFGEVRSENHSLLVQKHLHAATLPIELQNKHSPALAANNSTTNSTTSALDTSSSPVSFKYPNGVEASHGRISSVQQAEQVITNHSVASYNDQHSYWYWLKPFLMCAEVIPFFFFLWNLLRTYQIQYRQRDWIMNLMGAHPSDIRRLLHYRAALLAVSASCIGLLGFTGLTMAWKAIPILSIEVSVEMILSILLTGLCLSTLAASFPPPANADPML